MISVVVCDVLSFLSKTSGPVVEEKLPFFGIAHNSSRINHTHAMDLYAMRQAQIQLMQTHTHVCTCTYSNSLMFSSRCA
jgi:hypothetical protein